GRDVINDKDLCHATPVFSSTLGGQVEREPQKGLDLLRESLGLQPPASGDLRPPAGSWPVADWRRRLQ
ncbi:hypothetical protein, partial [Acidovorax sp. HMWF029]|uniref:hypothetical protein n=1 Tax=Acidovorax sp. HMWF029 TaxID=2056863 RepID=UPI001E455DBD